MPNRDDTCVLLLRNDMLYTVSVKRLDGVCEVIIARAARIAKLGARVGRFTKMVKMLRFLPGMGGEKAQGSAKVESETSFYDSGRLGKRMEKGRQLGFM